MVEAAIDTGEQDRFVFKFALLQHGRKQRLNCIVRLGDVESLVVARRVGRGDKVLPQRATVLAFHDVDQGVRLDVAEEVPAP